MNERNCGNFPNSFDFPIPAGNAAFSAKDLNERVFCKYLMGAGDPFPLVLRTAVLKCFGCKIK
jgi:hypothetical protein